MYKNEACRVVLYVKVRHDSVSWADPTHQSDDLVGNCIVYVGIGTKLKLGLVDEEVGLNLEHRPKQPVPPCSP